MKKCSSRDEQEFVKKLDPLVLVLLLDQNFSTFLLCSLYLSELEFNRKKFSVVSENLFL
jgi:hypothetical protein